MKGKTDKMRETLEQTAIAVEPARDMPRDEEFNYLVGFYRPHWREGEHRKTYKIVSAPFAHPENAEYNGE
jgi:hypothetical protein